MSRAEQDDLIKQLENHNEAIDDDPKNYFLEADALLGILRAVGVYKTGDDIFKIIHRNLSPEFAIEKHDILEQPWMNRSLLESVIRSGYADRRLSARKTPQPAVMPVVPVVDHHARLFGGGGGISSGYQQQQQQQ